MKKWHLIIDVGKCENCNNCFLSCKDEHVDNDWPGYTLSQPRHGHRWMNIRRRERGQYPMIDAAYRPTPCMHCDHAPCIQATEYDTIYKRADGLVLIDPEKAAGRKDLVDACPYGSIWWNNEKKVPQKCTLCAHLLDKGWRQTRCTQVCPTGALRVVWAKDDQMAAVVSDENFRVLHPEYGTRPRVYYKNLYRFDCCFIGGSVAMILDKVVDCAPGARVTLFNNSGKLAETVTDTFGDFKFDGLRENTGRYMVEIELAEFKNVRVEIDLVKSVKMPDVVLEPLARADNESQ